MYKKEFDLEITATTPFSTNEGEQAVTGIMITGTTRQEKISFLDDVFLGDRRPGLGYIIGNKLPIDGSCVLKFSERQDEMLTFPGIKGKIPCTVTHIEAGAGDSAGIFDVKMKIKVPHATSKVAGEIVNTLRTTVTIKIDSDQKDLFEEKQKD